MALHRVKGVDLLNKTDQSLDQISYSESSTKNERRMRHSILTGTNMKKGKSKAKIRISRREATIYRSTINMVYITHL
jgi:hypothetical protein